MKKHRRFFAQNMLIPFGGVYDWQKNAKWIHHPVYQEELLLKLNQLQVANQLGLKTPPTIVTNQPEEVINFYRIYPEVFCNLLSYDFYGYEPEDELAVYTSLVDESTMLLVIKWLQLQYFHKTFKNHLLIFA